MTILQYTSEQIQIRFFLQRLGQVYLPVVDGVGLFERRGHAVVEEHAPVLGDLPVLPEEGKLSWVIRICSAKFPQEDTRLIVKSI